VIYVGADFKNGGIAGVYRAVQTAAIELGWSVSKVDANGDPALLRRAFGQAVESHPDGIILGGFQADEIADLAARARSEGVVLVGWHAAEAQGATRELFANVSTDPLTVAETATRYALSVGARSPGVVIFTDSRFAIARTKTERLKQVVERCGRCKLLSVEDVPISSAARLVPEVVIRLSARYGRAWTHTLAINDVYFDNMNYPLIYVGRRDIVNVSAGDGSHKALGRLQSGLSQHLATVAEPLNAQGWQLMDELNRAFAGERPSGFVTKPLLITTETLRRTGASEMEIDIGYKEAYREIWHAHRVASQPHASMTP
jgi:ribose transport system substrate-binding protein